MPYTWSWATANSRHCRRTGQPAQIPLALAICCSAGPLAEMGMKRSGSADRQAAAYRQSAEIPVPVIASSRSPGLLLVLSVMSDPRQRQVPHLRKLSGPAGGLVT